jgi:hypothetical protein
MSTRKLIPHALALMFTLSLAGTASARRPPALAQAQEQSDRVFATCPESAAPSTDGYRDMLARVQNEPMVSRAVATTLPAPRRMGNHLVLVCSGGEVHQGSGYRDFPVRVPLDAERFQIARARSVLRTAAAR